MATTVTNAGPSRPPYTAAALVSLGALVLYVVTLAPTTAMWDTSEYMAAAYVLGLPHPPGNPLFVLVGRVFSILPIAPSVAQRINLLAALSSAAAAGFWFLIAHRVLADWVAVRWQRIAGAVVAALLGATAFTVWNQSVVNEKVYTVSLIGLALISWLALRWLDAPDGRRGDRILLLIAYLLGLGYANHMAGMLAAPAVAVAVLVRRPATIVRWRLLAMAGLMLALGLTPFATQPIRAALHPEINTGEPTGCVDGLKVGCTFSETTVDRFRDNLNRIQYGKPPLLERQASITDQLGMWWMYFEWQWLRDAGGTARTAQATLAVIFLALGLVGGWVHWRHHRQSFIYFAPLMVTLTLGLIFYLNFRLGYSQAVDRGLPIGGEISEVRDRDYFYLWSFSAWGVWAGLGLVWAWRALAGVANGAERRGERRVAVASPAANRRLILAAPILALALVPLIGNWRDASRAGDTFTREWAIDLLNSVEPYGILITNGDNDTFPLWYAQEVEGVRRDVTVAVAELLGTDWYVRQIIRRPVHEYDVARGPAIYRDRTWRKPAAPALPMSIEAADSIQQLYLLPGPQQFVKDSMVVTIRGDSSPYLPQRYLGRDHIVVLRFIRDSFPDRPIYFSGPHYAQNLGFGGYLVRQGLVERLVPGPAERVPGVVRVDGGGWVDPERTVALWRDVYTAPESLLTHGRWVDAASDNIPRWYAGTAILTSQLLAGRGDAAASQAVMDTARKIIDIVGLD
jgi:hypothetical protein